MIVTGHPCEHRSAAQGHSTEAKGCHHPPGVRASGRSAPQLATGLPKKESSEEGPAQWGPSPADDERQVALGVGLCSTRSVKPALIHKPDTALRVMSPQIRDCRHTGTLPGVSATPSTPQNEDPHAAPRSAELPQVCQPSGSGQPCPLPPATREPPGCKCRHTDRSQAPPCFLCPPSPW